MYDYECYLQENYFSSSNILNLLNMNDNQFNRYLHDITYEDNILLKDVKETEINTINLIKNQDVIIKDPYESLIKSFNIKPPEFKTIDKFINQKELNPFISINNIHSLQKDYNLTGKMHKTEEEKIKAIHHSIKTFEKQLKRQQMKDKEITNDIIKKVIDCLYENSQVIPSSSFDLGTVPQEEFKIEIKDENLLTLDQDNYYWMKRNPKIMKLLEEEILDWQKHNLCREAHISEIKHISSLLAVPKKKQHKDDEEEFRICLALQRLNKATILKPHPIPTITSQLRKVKKINASIDIRRGYQNIRIHQDSQKYCGFRLGNKTYVQTRMGYGYKNAPFVFQRIIESMLEDIKDASNYIDDILISSESHEELAQSFIKVIRQMRKFGLKLRLDKTHLFKRNIENLGRFIDNRGTVIKNSDIMKIINLKPPENIKQIRSLQGLLNWLQNYMSINKYKQYFRYRLFSKKFIWTKEHTKKFEEMKKFIFINRNNLIYHYIDGARLIIETDSSKLGCGAVIYQIVKRKENNKSHDNIKLKSDKINKNVIEDYEVQPIAYLNYTLNDQQERWHSSDLEMLGIIKAIEWINNNIGYTDICKFILTDCTRIIDMVKRMNKEKFKRKNTRLHRWMQALSLHNLIFIHHKVSMADYLSRNMEDRMKEINLQNINLDQYNQENLGKDTLVKHNIRLLKDIPKQLYTFSKIDKFSNDTKLLKDYIKQLNESETKFNITNQSIKKDINILNDMKFINTKNNTNITPLNVQISTNDYKLYLNKDKSLVEINPIENQESKSIKSGTGSKSIKLDTQDILSDNKVLTRNQRKERLNKELLKKSSKEKWKSLRALKEKGKWKSNRVKNLKESNKYHKHYKENYSRYKHHKKRYYQGKKYYKRNKFRRFYNKYNKYSNKTKLNIRRLAEKQLIEKEKEEKQINDYFNEDILNKDISSNDSSYITSSNDTFIEDEEILDEVIPKQDISPIKHININENRYRMIMNQSNQPEIVEKLPKVAWSKLNKLKRDKLNRIILDNKESNLKLIRNLILFIHIQFNHLQYQQLMNEVNQRVNISNIHFHCRIVIDCCVKCNIMRERRKHYQPFKNILPLRGVITIDIKEIRIKDNSNPIYLLVIIDYFTNYTYISKLKEATGYSVMLSLNHYFTIFGKAEYIILDKGSHFCNILIKDYTERMEVKLIFGTPYHHEGRGKVERMMRIINHFIKTLDFSNINHSNIEFIIDLFMSKMNNQVNVYNKYGNSHITANKLIFGENKNSTIDLKLKTSILHSDIKNKRNYVKILKSILNNYNLINQNNIKRYHKQKEIYYQKARKKYNYSYNIGEYILVNHRAFGKDRNKYIRDYTEGYRITYIFKETNRCILYNEKLQKSLWTNLQFIKPLGSNKVKYFDQNPLNDLINQYQNITIEEAKEISKFNRGYNTDYTSTSTSDISYFSQDYKLDSSSDDTMVTMKSFKKKKFKKFNKYKAKRFKNLKDSEELSIKTYKSTSKSNSRNKSKIHDNSNNLIHKFIKFSKSLKFNKGKHIDINDKGKAIERIKDRFNRLVM